MRTYVAFVDPSGGSSDSMTLAVAHLSIFKKAILDGYWERKPPFSPDSVVEEFALTLKEYRIAQVVGDRYAGAWVSERFKEHGIAYTPSERTKSEIYNDFVALANSGRVCIPKSKRLRFQFEALERRTSRSGKDTVDHAIGGHDDIANCVAGVLCLASKRAAEQPWSMVITVPTPARPLAADQRTPSFGRAAGRSSFDERPSGHGRLPRDGPEHWWERIDQ